MIRLDFSVLKGMTLSKVTVRKVHDTITFENTKGERYQLFYEED